MKIENYGNVDLQLPITLSNNVLFLPSQKDTGVRSLEAGTESPSANPTRVAGAGRVFARIAVAMNCVNSKGLDEIVVAT
jgi:hypothetical protein